MKNIYRKYKAYRNRYPMLIPWISAVLNLSFGLVNLWIGTHPLSYWNITLAVYFLILGLMRLYAASAKNKRIVHVMKLDGVIMLFLAVVIAGITVLTIHQQVYPAKGMIAAIVQAAYTFIMFGVSLYNLLKAHKQKNPRMMIVRNISHASAIGAVLSLQRTMLGTFGAPGSSFNIQIEAWIGALAFLILIAVAVKMIFYKPSSKK